MEAGRRRARWEGCEEETRREDGVQEAGEKTGRRDEAESSSKEDSVVQGRRDEGPVVGNAVVCSIGQIRKWS